MVIGTCFSKLKELQEYIDLPWIKKIKVIAENIFVKNRRQKLKVKNRTCERNCDQAKR